MTTEITPTQALTEQIRFYLNTPDKVAQALVLIRNTEKMLEQAKLKVTEKGKEMMDKAQTNVINYETVDPDTGEVISWEVRRMEPTEIFEYNALDIMEVLGKDAFKFFKVSSKVRDEITKRHASKAISNDDLIKATKNAKTKTRKGFIKLTQK